MSPPGVEAVEGIRTPRMRKQGAEEQAAARVWGTAVKRAQVRLAVLPELVRVAEQEQLAQQGSLAPRVLEGLQVKQGMLVLLRAGQQAREVL